MKLHPSELTPTLKRLNPELCGAAVVSQASGPESDLHADIIAHCKREGWIYFHGSMAHKAMRTVGEPDFTLLLPAGRVLFVECKTAKGKLSSEQLGLKLWAERLGHTVHVVRSMDEFRRVLEIGKGEA